jgi:signal transduction histidine kinase
MTPLGEWLKPPRTLLLFLFLLTLASVSALSWFGWKVVDRERMVEAQRLQQRVEQSADRIAATLRGTLAETGELLGASSITPPDDGLLLLLEDNQLTARPANRLLYYPTASAGVEAPQTVFAEAEAAEFLRPQLQPALEAYQRLADSPNPAIRAGALLREARVLRKMGQSNASRAVFQELAGIPRAAVAGTPADLVARHALSELSKNGAGAAELKRDLLSGRWRLTRGQFNFYWSEAGRMSGQAEPPPAEAVALSEAAAFAWQQRKRGPDLVRQETVWFQNQPFLLLWRGPAERRAILVTRPASILRPILTGAEVSCAAVDAEGRVLAGEKAATSHATIRTAVETQLPWTLYVTATPLPSHYDLLAPERFLILGICVMALFLIAGTYFIARAIRRENEVVRMQADFVAAVSHEFRSPLTSMKQLSEILAAGRAPSGERRQMYYETLVRETSRLQRLIEALLNFGRMEAGGRSYRFEQLDAASLVRRVAAEFEGQMAASGRRIEIDGSPPRCPVEADPEAISVALRNLVDNAIKYSPGHPTIWMEWAKENDCVAIRVRDQGPGVARSERKAIFRKFVRGSAASAANVRGSGLGLAMVRHIVTAHRGAVTLASQPGQGSTFTILLPATERA